MSNRVLVAYASKYGSTAEIAEAIGQAMQGAGLRVDVLKADAVGDLTPYGAVVLGSAVYAGKWRPEAVRFLESREAELAQRPGWLFSSGPTGKGDPVERLGGWRFPKAQQPIADRISPRDIAVFHGSLDTKKLGFAEKRIIKVVEAKIGDYRDWDAIRTWASGIKLALSG